MIRSPARLPGVICHALQKVHVVDTDLGNDKRYQNGYGYIEFNDNRAAVEGMKRRAASF